MAKRSIFRDFIASLRKRWREEWPQMRPIEAPLGPSMPKASTFYAGFSSRLGMHVFVHFDHSPKAWEVGQFIVDLILSRREGAPEGRGGGGPFAPDDGRSFTEGRYRLCSVLGQRRDKWWHLKQDDPPILGQAWRPTSYDDEQLVIAEAIADVTRDLREALIKLGLDGAAAATPPS
jgi:hypothetical protein